MKKIIFAWGLGSLFLSVFFPVTGYTMKRNDDDRNSWCRELFDGTSNGGSYAFKDIKGNQYPEFGNYVNSFHEIGYTGFVFNKTTREYQSIVDYFANNLLRHLIFRATGSIIGKTVLLDYGQYGIENIHQLRNYGREIYGRGNSGFQWLLQRLVKDKGGEDFLNWFDKMLLQEEGIWDSNIYIKQNMILHAKCTSLTKIMQIISRNPSLIELGADHQVVRSIVEKAEKYKKNNKNDSLENKNDNLGSLIVKMNVIGNRVSLVLADWIYEYIDHIITEIHTFYKQNKSKSVTLEDCLKHLVDNKVDKFISDSVIKQLKDIYTVEGNFLYSLRQKNGYNHSFDAKNVNGDFDITFKPQPEWL